MFDEEFIETTFIKEGCWKVTNGDISPLKKIKFQRLSE